MTVFYIILAIFLIFIFFVLGPALGFSFSVFGRRRVVKVDDPVLVKPALDPYRERVIADYHYLMSCSPEQVSVTASDGAKLSADLYDRGKDKLAIMVHGYNADPYVNLAAQARWFYDNGFDLLVIYQRAHTPSPVKHNGMGLIEKDDVLTWADMISQKLPGRKILLYGVSMGGTAVSCLSDKIENGDVCCAVNDCGYISPYDQMKRESKRFHMPFRLLIPIISLYARIVVGIDVSEKTTDHLRNCRLPMLFIYGDADPTVPLSTGEESYNACLAPKTLVIAEGAEHTVAFLKEEEKITAAYRDFINKYIR